MIHINTIIHKIMTFMIFKIIFSVSKSPPPASLSWSRMMIIMIMKTMIIILMILIKMMMMILIRTTLTNVPQPPNSAAPHQVTFSLLTPSPPRPTTTYNCSFQSLQFWKEEKTPKLLYHQNHYFLQFENTNAITNDFELFKNYWSDHRWDIPFSSPVHVIMSFYSNVSNVLILCPWLPLWTARFHDDDSVDDDDIQGGLWAIAKGDPIKKIATVAVSLKSFGQRNIWWWWWWWWWWWQC